MNEAFLDYFRCPEAVAQFRPASPGQEEYRRGFFEIGAGNICFGNVSSVVSPVADKVLCNVADKIVFDGSTCVLPFDPTEAARNLRQERYVAKEAPSSVKTFARKVYYALRPVLPVLLRRPLQKAWLKGWEKTAFPTWPVDCSVDAMFEMLMRMMLQASGENEIPFIWFWPDGMTGCATMTHDVETDAGLKFCRELMDINDSFGIKSSFQLIPDARYTVRAEDLVAIKERGFEANVHDLKHDGHLFDDYQQFQEAAVKINEFGARFGSDGFRAAVLYRNQEWFSALDFAYDMSVPNVGHLDPQRGGCCTVMPYFINDLVEIPVTATQDYTLFHVLKLYSIDLWREQMRRIFKKHGMASFIVHPDYLDTQKAVSVYKELLGYLAELRATAKIWIALPGEINRWWRQRSKMKLVSDHDGWHIEGEGCDRAQIAYARLRDGKLIYELAE
jgi:hypothetical protein